MVLNFPKNLPNTHGVQVRQCVVQTKVQYSCNQRRVQIKRLAAKSIKKLIERAARYESPSLQPPNSSVQPPVSIISSHLIPASILQRTHIFVCLIFVLFFSFSLMVMVLMLCSFAFCLYLSICFINNFLSESISYYVIVAQITL